MPSPVLTFQYDRYGQLVGVSDEAMNHAGALSHIGTYHDKDPVHVGGAKNCMVTVADMKALRRRATAYPTESLATMIGRAFFIGEEQFHEPIGGGIPALCDRKQAKVR